MCCGNFTKAEQQDKQQILLQSIREEQELEQYQEQLRACNQRRIQRGRLYERLAANTTRSPPTVPRTLYQRRNRLPESGEERTKIQPANRLYSGFPNTEEGLIQGQSSTTPEVIATLETAAQSRHPDDRSIIPALEFLLAISNEPLKVSIRFTNFFIIHFPLKRKNIKLQLC